MLRICWTKWFQQHIPKSYGELHAGGKFWWAIPTFWQDCWVKPLKWGVRQLYQHIISTWYIIIHLFVGVVSSSSYYLPIWPTSQTSQPLQQITDSKSIMFWSIVGWGLWLMWLSIDWERSPFWTAWTPRIVSRVGFSINWKYILEVVVSLSTVPTKKEETNLP